jgi:hypothetical protein
MPGRFDKELEINDHGCLTPAGPLELDRGETVLRLDAWIWQNDGACIAVQFKFPDKNRWEITTDPEESHKGEHFKPGAAAAMGLMVSRMADGQTKTFQWSDAIFLYEKGKPLNTLLSAAKSEAALTS